MQSATVIIGNLAQKRAKLLRVLINMIINGGKGSEIIVVYSADKKHFLLNFLGLRVQALFPGFLLSDNFKSADFNNRFQIEGTKDASSVPWLLVV